MRAPRRLVVLVAALAVGAPAGAAPMAPILHGTLSIEARGLDAAPLGIATFMLTGIELPMHFAALTHKGVKVPHFGPADGLFINDDYLVTVHFTLVGDGGAYHLEDATLQYTMHDDNRLESKTGPTMHDHMWASGTAEVRGGRLVGASAKALPPTLTLRFDPDGTFHLDGDVRHPITVQGRSAMTSPMGGIVLEGKAGRLILHGELPVALSHVPAGASPAAAMMKQAAALATRPQDLSGLQKVDWPVHVDGRANGQTIHAVRTLPMLTGGQEVIWLEVGP